VAPPELKWWLLHHQHRPYPTAEEEALLCSTTGITIGQLRGWFESARSLMASYVVCGRQGRHGDDGDVSRSTQLSSSSLDDFDLHVDGDSATQQSSSPWIEL
jgi:hypothetical protein